jgi:hypothetical protein
MSELTPDQVSAARRKAATKQHERGERAMSRLFRSDAECHLRSAAHAEYSRTRGPGVAFNQHAANAHADAVVASMKPILDEVHLSGPEASEFRVAMTRAPPTPEEGEARREQFIEDARRPIYGTRKVVEQKLAATRTAVLKAPALSKGLNTGAAGMNVHLHRGLSRRVEEGEPILRSPKTII